MEYLDNFCAITEFIPNEFHLTRVSIFSFIQKNQWFDGTIIILTLDKSKITSDQLDQLDLIYSDIKILEVDANSILELKAKPKRFQPNLDPLLNYLYTFAFKIKSKGNIYFSNRIVFNKSADSFLNINKATFAIDSNRLPTGDGSDLNLSMFYVPGEYQSDALHMTIVNKLKSHKNVSRLNSDSIKESLFNHEVDIETISSINLVDSSNFSNGKYRDFLRYSKAICAINMSTIDLSDPRFKRIHLYWQSINKQYLKYKPSIKSSHISHDNLKISRNRTDTYSDAVGKKQKKNGPPSLRADNISLTTAYDADFCVMITTYNRKKCIESLTNSLKTLNPSCKVVVIDDCSDDEIDTSNIDTYIKLSENNGKENWWKTVNLLWDKALGYNCKYYMMLPDDSLPNPGMFEDAIRIWNSIDDPLKIAMHLANNNRERNWTNYCRTEYNNDVYKTQTTEFSFLCTGYFIRYIIPPINKNRWKKNNRLGSGVGERLNRYWVNHKKNIYGVKTSLISSNCLCPDSVMNVEERKINPWILK